MEMLKNKWVLGMAAFLLATVVVYLFVPLFKVSIFGIDTGLGYLKIVFKTKNVSNIVSFLLPFIGCIGGIACGLCKGRGPHILTVAFSLLPVMFFSYFIIMLQKYASAKIMGIELVSVFDLVGSGIWLGLLSSLLALAASVMLVVSDKNKFKS
mgnify:FL=1|jgi:hypothetical protein